MPSRWIQKTDIINQIRKSDCLYLWYDPLDYPDDSWGEAGERSQTSVPHDRHRSKASAKHHSKTDCPLRTEAHPSARHITVNQQGSLLHWVASTCKWIPHEMPVMHVQQQIWHSSLSVPPYVTLLNWISAFFPFMLTEMEWLQTQMGSRRLWWYHTSATTL